MEIRELTEHDAAAYREIRLMALTESPQAFVTEATEFGRKPLSEIRHQLHSNQLSTDMLFVGAFVDNKLVGTQGLYRHAKTKVRHRTDIVGVFVHPNYRGRGIAGAMLDVLIDGARAMPGVTQILLGVTTTQEPAIALYESRGFVTFGVEPRMIRVGERYYDIMHMIKFL